MCQREKDVWRDIFELYRDLPCLWKNNDDHYHNRDMRSQAMSLLYEKYKTFDENATLAVFKKKLENMRTSYGRERKRVRNYISTFILQHWKTELHKIINKPYLKITQWQHNVMNSTQTGASIDDVYVPMLWYYELLTFLDEKDTAARSGVDTSVSADEDCNSEAPPAVKRNKVSSFQKKQERLLDTTNKILNAKEEDWEIIGRSIGVQLRDLTANQKVIARKLISDVIFFGSTEQLTNNSFISIPSSSIISSTSPSTTSVPFPLTSPQYEYNENQYILPSPLPPTSGNTSHSLNHPNINLKRRPRPSSTSIETQQYVASPLSAANSSQIANVNFGSISQDDRRNYSDNEELSRNMSPLPPALGNTSHSLNRPKIIIKRPLKISSTPIGSQQYVASPSFAKSPQITNNSLGAISQDDSLDYVNHKQSSVIYEGKGSELGQFLLFNKKHES